MIDTQLFSLLPARSESSFRQRRQSKPSQFSTSIQIFKEVPVNQYSNKKKNVEKAKQPINSLRKLPLKIYLKEPIFPVAWNASFQQEKNWIFQLSFAKNIQEQQKENITLERSQLNR